MPSLAAEPSAHPIATSRRPRWVDRSAHCSANTSANANSTYSGSPASSSRRSASVPGGSACCWPPMTCSPTPRITSIMPSVVSSALSPAHAISSPLTSPTSAPHASAAPSARGTGAPCSWSTTKAPPHRNIVEPTEMSMRPVRITSASPADSSSSAAELATSSSRLNSVRNAGEYAALNATSAAKAT